MAVVVVERACGACACKSGCVRRYKGGSMTRVHLRCPGQAGVFRKQLAHRLPVPNLLPPAAVGFHLRLPRPSACAFTDAAVVVDLLAIPAACVRAAV